MPNHVTNILTVEGNQDALKSLLNDKGDIDFNSVIPMLPKMVGHHPHRGIENRVEAALGLLKMPSQETPTGMDDITARLKFSNAVRTIMSPIEEDDVSDTIDAIITSLELWRDHGHMYWYPWSIENWGTKWNAYEQKVTDDSLRFETAWRTPKKVFEALSLKHPDCKFHVTYADKAIGSNCGTLTFQAGRIVGEWEPEKGAPARKFAFETCYPGKDPADHDLDENFEYVEED